MLEKFYPDLIVERVQDIDLEILKKNKIKGLILDIDNTLVPMHQKEADQNAVDWIEKVKASGLKACIVSNATHKRVIRFNESLKLHAIHKASKPGTKSFYKAAKLMGIGLNEVAVVGDQIFTDIFGGNRINMFTILTMPIDKREAFYIKLKRFPEKLILSRYKSNFAKTYKKRIEWKVKSARQRIKKHDYQGEL